MLPPRSLTACSSLPPEGAVSPKGGLSAKRFASLATFVRPELVEECPPRGLALLGAARRGGLSAHHWRPLFVLSVSKDATLAVSFGKAL